MTDDQFRDLIRMLRLILMALTLIAGLLAGFLWMLRDRPGLWTVPGRAVAAACA